MHNFESKVFTIWLTGLSGSGKSTLAFNLKGSLLRLNYCCAVLDGDDVRRGINSDLDFSLNGRNENVRRVAEIAKTLNDQGYFVIVALISPLRSQREIASNIIGKDNFKEVYLDASLDVCEIRDVKGLYKKARKGLIQNFTGISADYESSLTPDITIHTGFDDEKKSLDILLNFFLSKI